MAIAVVMAMSATACDGKSSHTLIVAAVKLTAEPLLLDDRIISRDSVVAEPVYVPLPVSQLVLLSQIV